MASANVNYRDYLQHEFSSRCRRNPHYSMRAFARDLEIAPSKLSEVLNRKCGLSAAAAKEVARRLRLNTHEAEHFLALVESEHSRSPARKLEAKERLQVFQASMGYSELDLERFRVISDWIHFAVLELTDVSDFEPSSIWIAQRLDVPENEVEAAVARLFKFGLLEKNHETWQPTTVDLATPNEVPSREKRDHHTQILRKAMIGLDRYEVSERDYASMTLSFASDQLPEAKKALLEFRRSFAKRFQKKTPKDRVFSLSMQFFPLDRIPTPAAELSP